MGSLAAQLQQAKLKRTQQPTSSQPNENSGNSTSSSGSGGAGNYGTIGRTTTGGGEMASMMDEMAKTLARRRERQKDSNVSNSLYSSLRFKQLQFLTTLILYSTESGR